MMTELLFLNSYPFEHLFKDYAAKCLFSLLLGSLCQQFQRPPARREPPSARLMRKAFLISEADNIEDYRTQIMSTFGQVLKYDSTKKVNLTQWKKSQFVNVLQNLFTVILSGNPLSERFYP